MKQKKIVYDSKRKTPLYKNKRWTLVFILLLLLLAFTVISAPMADIPFLGRMGGWFGLNDESMRSLTFADFAAYSFGVADGGRLASVRNSQYSVYESSGGLSPFSLQSSNRLIDAKESYLKEFDRTGKWNNIKGSAAGMGIDDPEGVNVAGYYGGNGAVAPVIDPEQEQEYKDTYGKPFVSAVDEGSIEDAYAASSATKYDDNGNLVLRSLTTSKPFKSKKQGAIRSARSDENNMYFQALNAKAKFRFGRLGAFGGDKAKTFRISTNIGSARQMNMFGQNSMELSRAFFLSNAALGQKYNDVIKNVADAAFDGSEIEAEDLIALGEKGERPQANGKDVSNITNTTLAVMSQMQMNMDLCKEAKKQYHKSLQEDGKLYKDLIKQLADARYDGGQIPGKCTWGWPFHPVVIATRQQWNATVDAIASTCEGINEKGSSYADMCGFNYKKRNCTTFTTYFKLKGKTNFWDELWGRCRRKVVWVNGGKGFGGDFNKVVEEYQNITGSAGTLEQKEKDEE